MTNKKTTTVRFISKYLNLKIVSKPSYNKEVEGRVIVVPGEAVRFSQGVYETSDLEVIKFLEARPEFGKVFTRVPDNVEALVHREKMLQTFEEREADLKRRETELAEREAKNNAKGEGSSIKEGDENEIPLGAMKVKDLLEICATEEVPDWERFKKPGTKKADIIVAISENRDAEGEKGPAY